MGAVSSSRSVLSMFSIWPATEMGQRLLLRQVIKIYFMGAGCSAHFGRNHFSSSGRYCSFTVSRVFLGSTKKQLKLQVGLRTNSLKFCCTAGITNYCKNKETNYSKQKLKRLKTHMFFHANLINLFSDVRLLSIWSF